MPIDRARRVLIVERQRTSARLVEGMLHRLAFDNIHKTFDAASAFSILQEGGAWLVIADLHLTPMSGLELLRMLRTNQRLERHPFLITAETLSPVEARALKDAGVDGIILKPFTHKVLEPKVAAALESSARARRAVAAGVTRKRWTALGRRSRYRRS
jgi:PleD family two-component response regulator